LETGDIKAAVAVERAITSSLELVARLVGQFVTRHESVHTLLTPSYLRLRQALAEALRDYPDAAKAVADKLCALEVEAATEFQDRAQRGAPLLLEAAPA
jgi:hypothetical protein